MAFGAPGSVLSLMTSVPAFRQGCGMIFPFSEASHCHTMQLGAVLGGQRTTLLPGDGVSSPQLAAPWIPSLDATSLRLMTG
jgi:hypothetical protein